MTMEANVQQAVPFFIVSSMEASLRFYVDGLGFVMKRKWIDDGKLKWCWLDLGEASVMLQEFGGGRPPGSQGVSICFLCRDAITLFHEFRSRGVAAQRPFVGNGLWVTSVTDPDGYLLDFESPTDAPEESVYEEESVPS